MPRAQTQVPAEYCGASATAIDAAWRRHETHQTIDKVRRSGERVNAAWAWVDARPRLAGNHLAVNAALRLRAERPELTGRQLEAIIVDWLATHPAEEAA